MSIVNNSRNEATSYQREKSCVFSFQLWIESGTYSQINLRFINVSHLPRKFGDTFCRARLGYHAFTGCDYTAVYCRKEKIRPFKILEINLKCQEVFGRIGLQEKISEDDSAEIGMYVCAV